MAAVVDREAPIGHQRPGSGAQRIALEGVDQIGECIGKRAGQEGIEVVYQLCGHRLVSELPDHRAELVLGVQAQAVVDPFYVKMTQQN